MTEFIRVLLEQASVISDAPIAFVVLALATFGLAYVAVRWKYTSVIEQKDATIENLKERLQFRVDQVEEYRGKAAKFDEKAHAVVDSSSAILKKQALEMASNIREFVHRHQLNDDVVQTDLMSIERTEDPEARNRKWATATMELSRRSAERNAEWNRRFKIDAVILRDELRSRLKDYVPDARLGDSYDHPVNYFGFNYVADDLEKMAKSLRD